MLVHDAGEERVRVLLVSGRDDLPEVAARTASRKEAATTERLCSGTSGVSPSPPTCSGRDGSLGMQLAQGRPMVLIPSRLVLGVATGFFLSALWIAGQRFLLRFGRVESS